MPNTTFRRFAFAALFFAATCMAGCSQTTDTSANSSNNANRPEVSTTTNSDAHGTPTPASAENSNAQTSPGSSFPSANSSRSTNASETKMPQPQVGSGGNDFFLFTQARAAINKDDELKNASINIDVKDGAATLTGAVANDGQRQRAEQLVKGVQGIKSVNNRLRVSAGGSK